MFRSEGTFKVTITDARLAKPKFATDPAAFDIALRCETDDGQWDWWRGEISGEYGKGNFSDRTQAEITLEQLQKIGWEHGTNFRKIDLIVGTETTANVKCKDGTDGKTYYNISYLGGGSNEPQELGESEFESKLSGINAFFPSMAEDSGDNDAAREKQEKQEKPQTAGGGKNPFA